jgi:hypothetical protein
VTSTVIHAEVEIAKQNGAPGLEAYPLDKALTQSTSFTGYCSTFLRAGFRLLPDVLRLNQ